MENGSMQLTAVDLLERAAPAMQSHRNHQSTAANGPPETALRLCADSARQDQNREIFLILLLWLCCLGEVGAAFGRLFL